MTKDAIIVLAQGVKPDGSLPEIAKLRVEKGVDLFKEGIAPRIIMSGHWGFWATQEFPKTEAQAMKEYAMTLGVPEEAILKEEESGDTIGNAYFSRVKFLDPNNWHKVAVVTSEYHIPRSEVIFKKVLGPDFDIDFVSVDSKLTPEESQKHQDKETKTIKVLHDWIDPIPDGDLDKIHTLLYTKHPGYASNPEVSKEQLLKILGRE